MYLAGCSVNIEFADIYVFVIVFVTMLLKFVVYNKKRLVL